MHSFQYARDAELELSYYLDLPCGNGGKIKLRAGYSTPNSFAFESPERTPRSLSRFWWVCSLS